MPFVAANGIRTYYEMVGEGAPLLLIAGNGMDHTAFRDQVSVFSPHFRCVTYDLRGIGRSDVPDAGYTVPDMACDALTLLDALGMPQAHVAGYSLGGAIALQMAIDAPNHVGSLSLYSTFSHVEPYLRRRYEILLEILVGTTPALWAMFTTFSAFGEAYINAHDDEIGKEIALRISRWKGPDAPSKVGLVGHYRAILGHEVRSRLAEIRCPTWIAVGSSDPVTPPSYARYLHEHIAGSRISIYEGAPHRLLNFTPRFNADALEFLLDARHAAKLGV
ncbi:MAG TPA: alpha/beta hydrolase [Casimicrobiaceae bacterium]|nr:alpha/beta hydrolase [Casimicrobiaceae bacterium]